MSSSTRSLEDMLERRPVNRAAVEAHKQRILDELEAHLDSEHDEPRPTSADSSAEIEHEAADKRSAP